MFKFLIDEIDKHHGPVPNLHGADIKPNNLDGIFIPSYYALEHDNWFYPICLNTLYHLNTLFHHQKFLKNLLPENVIKGLEQNRGYILVEIFEPMNLDVIKYLEYISERPPLFNKIKFLTINQCSHKNLIHSTGFETTSYTLDSEIVPNGNREDNEHEPIGIESVENFRDRTFSCFLFMYSRNADRFEILNLLEKLNLLEIGFVSAYNNAKDFDSLYKKSGCFSSLNSGTPPTFSSHDKVFGNLSFKEVYDKTKINLVVEGDISNNNHTYLSEKTFRNFKLKKPFILLGQHASLKMLKELGYKTFSDIIDESYDEIEDDKLRIYTALKELIRFHKQNPDISKINHVLEHNFNHQNSKAARVTKQLSALFDVR
jgi:hypothetical protein